MSTPEAQTQAGTDASCGGGGGWAGGGVGYVVMVVVEW